MKPKTPKRTRLSNDFKLAIIEAAKTFGLKPATWGARAGHLAGWVRQLGALGGLGES